MVKLKLFISLIFLCWSYVIAAVDKSVITTLSAKWQHTSFIMEIR